MNRLRALWDDFRSSLWFVPTLLVAGAAAAAAGLIELDASLDHWRLAERFPRLFGAGAEGSRELLSAIASSMITVAGVIFSITVVALTLASSQYTSRILRNFMRDRANQTVLGVFLGVFAYCLVVIRTIRGGSEGEFVPALAVFVGLLLAFLAIGFLIFFIHHIATSIQATSILESVALETLQVVDRLFPTRVDEGTVEVEKAVEEPSAQSWIGVPAATTGYLQGVDLEALVGVARERGGWVRMEKGIGEFLIEGSPLASVGDAEPSTEDVRRLNAAFIVGRHRTISQDAGYGIRQIVDVALKALSPGINDTTTAVIGIDFLGAILARLAERRLEPPFGSRGQRRRLITRGPSFQGLVSEAFDQIRQNAEGNVAVLRRLIEILEELVDRTPLLERRQALRQQIEWILETSERSVPAAHDRARIRAAVRPRGGDARGGEHPTAQD